jgi:hypothetical protein
MTTHIAIIWNKDIFTEVMYRVFVLTLIDFLIK